MINTHELDKSIKELGVSLRSEDVQLNVMRKAFVDSDRRPVLSKIEALKRVQTAVRFGKMDLVDAGNLERRINKGLPLEKSHQAALGLTGAASVGTIGDENPTDRFPTAKGPGRPAIPATGSPSPSFQRQFKNVEQPVNPAESMFAQMDAGRRAVYRFTGIDGRERAVSGREVLDAVTAAVRAGKITLVQAGEVERTINHELGLDSEMVRRIFS